MAEALLPSVKPPKAATIPSEAVHPDRLVTAAGAAPRVFAGIAERIWGVRGRRRARALAAAEQADAVERARAFGRLLGVRRD